MKETQKQHWENVYQTKKADQVSWFQPHLSKSLDLIVQSEIGLTASMIDVGGGASTLVDDLLEKGYSDISILDISGTALETSKKRLGNKADKVHWIEGDITNVKLPEKHFDLWHDRAVFHFLTDAASRQKYKKNLAYSLKPGGGLILATFSLKGPERCSGLNVMRYSPELLQAELGKGYRLIKTLEETHPTPFGTTQEFAYCFFRREN
ncbi:MAG: class I SAM-dependent methyltransferase [Candidatus Omnitrophica bacterium]|nr:class I SAM-dependent methyltransferase [Candidatus Omnitrophota bacterium]